MTARVPLAGLSGYANDLRAISQRTRRVPTAFAAFEPVRRGAAPGTDTGGPVN